MACDDMTEGWAPKWACACAYAWARGCMWACASVGMRDKLGACSRFWGGCRPVRMARAARLSPSVVAQCAWPTVLIVKKLEGPMDDILQTIWSNRWLGEVHKEATGSSGEILILWDKRVCKGEMVENGTQCITGKLTGVNEDFCWYISAVYANCNREIRRVLWEELRNTRNRFNG